MLCLALLAGCASVPKGSSTAGEFVVAIRFDLEPRLVGNRLEDAVQTARRDFEKAAEHGFTSMAIRIADESDVRTLGPVAADAGLSLSAPLRPLDYYILTGRLPVGCPNESALVDRVLRNRWPATVVVDCGRTSRTADRAGRLARLVSTRGRGCVALHESMVEGGTAHDAQGAYPRVATIEAGSRESAESDTPLEAWLAQYHRGLRCGLTDGIVIERFEQLFGDQLFFNAVSPSRLTERQAALRTLLTRVAAWGPRLQGLTPTPIEATGSAAVSATLFMRDRRRYVLVFNEGMTRAYARGDVSLPLDVGGMSVDRAVEVPSSPGRRAGNVFPVHQERVTLPVALRPGDAALYELF